MIIFHRGKDLLLFLEEKEINFLFAYMNIVWPYKKTD